MRNVRPPQRRKHDTFTSPSSLLSARPFAPTASHPPSSLLPKEQPANPTQVKGFGYSFEHMAVHHPDPKVIAGTDSERVASGETTNLSPRQLASDAGWLAEQEQPMPTAHGNASPVPSSASALQRMMVPASNPMTPPPPLNRQSGRKRSGWSFERMAITYNHLPPAQRRATDMPVTQKPSPQTEVLQQQPTEPALSKENTTGLPDHLKTGIESLSGLSLDDVHVHYNSSKPAQVDALAYTQGSEIHVGPGQDRHLAHEAWHVVQQKEGRVQPTMQMNGVAINDDPRLEREADHMGTMMLLPRVEPPRQVHTGSTIVQGMFRERMKATAPVMAPVDDTINKLSEEIITQVKEKLSTLQGNVEEGYTLLIRFFTTSEQMNSNAYKKQISVGSEPSQDELLDLAVSHMYLGNTEESPFVSFTEDIAAFMKSLDGPEVSLAVRSIVRGSNPQFYGKKGMERISQPPARYIGIFKVKKDITVRWEQVIGPANARKQSDPASTADLKMNFIPEREVVAYSPGEIDGPIATIENPFYQRYMDLVPEEAKQAE